MQSRDFRESPVKYSSPEETHYLPLSRVSQAYLDRLWSANGNKCP